MGEHKNKMVKTSESKIEVVKEETAQDLGAALTKLVEAVNTHNAAITHDAEAFRAFLSDADKCRPPAKIKDCPACYYGPPRPGVPGDENHPSLSETKTESSLCPSSCVPGCCVPEPTMLPAEPECTTTDFGYGNDLTGFGKVGGHASENRMKHFKGLVDEEMQNCEKILTDPRYAECMSNYDENIFFNILSDATVVGKRIKVAHSFKRLFNKFKAFGRGLVLFPRMLIALGEEFAKIKNAQTINANVIRPEELVDSEVKNGK